MIFIKQISFQIVLNWLLNWILNLFLNWLLNWFLNWILNWNITEYSYSFTTQCSLWEVFITKIFHFCTATVMAYNHVIKLKAADCLFSQGIQECTFSRVHSRRRRATPQTAGHRTMANIWWVRHISDGHAYH